MDLPLLIDRESPTPVYVQLAEQIHLLIHRGALAPGASLPTVRELAVHLGINANTVARVYRELQATGLLRLERGVGTFVAAQAVEPAISAKTFRRVSTRARGLVEAAHEAGLSRRELVQLVEKLWKEVAS